MPINAFRARHRFKVWCPQFPGVFFTELTGGNASNEVTQVHPGNRNAPVNVNGPVSFEQITVRKPYDAVADAPILAWSRAYDRGVELALTVIKQPVNAAGLPDGPQTSYLRCARVSFNEPEVGRGSAEAATLEIVLQPEQIL